MCNRLLVYDCNLISEISSVRKSGCGEKVEVGRTFEAYQEKFRGGHDFSVVLMQTKVLALSHTTKVPFVRLQRTVLRCRYSNRSVHCTRTEPSPSCRGEAVAWLPQGCLISPGRRKTLPRL